jgi:hypothetical protein
VPTSRHTRCSPSSSDSPPDFDDLPELIPGRPDYRLLIAAGTVVAAVSVLGQLAPDGTVELVGLKIDTRPIWPDSSEE